MTRVYTIWPANKEGLPAASLIAWRQDRHWLVLDVTEGLDAAHIVEGPVSRWMALHRELELRSTAKAKAADRSIVRKAGP
jgi:hypothetical protein